jgi:hypothetical protein
LDLIIYNQLPIHWQSFAKSTTKKRPSKSKPPSSNNTTIMATNPKTDLLYWQKLMQEARRNPKPVDLLGEYPHLPMKNHRHQHCQNIATALSSSALHYTMLLIPSSLPC